MAKRSRKWRSSREEANLVSPALISPLECLLRRQASNESDIIPRQLVDALLQVEHATSRAQIQLTILLLGDLQLSVKLSTKLDGFEGQEGRGGGGRGGRGGGGRAGGNERHRGEVRRVRRVGGVRGGVGR